MGRFLGRCPPVLGLVAPREVPARLEWTCHSAALAASVPEHGFRYCRLCCARVTASGTFC